MFVAGVCGRGREEKLGEMQTRGDASFQQIGTQHSLWTRTHKATEQTFYLLSSYHVKGAILSDRSHAFSNPQNKLRY